MFPEVIRLSDKAQTVLHSYKNWYFDIVKINDYWLWRLFKRERDVTETGNTFKYSCLVIGVEPSLDPEFQVLDVKRFIDEKILNA